MTYSPRLHVPYTFILRHGDRVLGAFTSLTQLAKAVNQKADWHAPTCDVWSSEAMGFESYPMTRKGLTDALARTFDSGYLAGRTYYLEGTITAVDLETGDTVYVSVEPTRLNSVLN